MIEHYQASVRMRRIVLAVISAVLMVTLSLVLLQLNARAGWRGSGARGCGDFINAVKSAEDGDTIAQMIPLKTTDGAIISKNIAIQGGWFPTANCAEENQVFTTTADLFAAGFVFQAPQTRSILAYDLGPVLTIDPAVISVTVQHIDFRQLGTTTTRGGGLSGVITGGAQVRLENLLITDSTVISGGGGLYFEVRGGSRLVISDSFFISNTATHDGGSGFEIHLYDNSEVIIHNTQISSNTTNGNGGGGRIIAHSGYVTITNSSFFGNQATNGHGLAIESKGSGPVQVWLNDNTFDGKSIPESEALYISGAGINLAGNNVPPSQMVFLPLMLKNVPFARITDITLDGSNYAVEFETIGFEPQLLPGKRHLHFFFNTVPPEEAGVPGAGPWKLYPSTQGAPAPSPFSGYSQNDKPAKATQMCVLIANYDHSVQLGTGNCSDLP
jgi:hypothetical protein